MQINGVEVGGRVHRLLGPSLGSPHPRDPLSTPFGGLGGDKRTQLSAEDDALALGSSVLRDVMGTLIRRHIRGVGGPGGQW